MRKSKKKVAKMHTSNPQIHRNSSKGRNRKTSLALILGISIMICGISAWTFYLRTTMGNLDREIQLQEESLMDLEKTRKDLASKIDGIRSSETVINRARFRLGMNYPEDEQIVYIDVDEKTEENDVNQNVFLNPIISMLSFFNKS